MMFLPVVWLACMRYPVRYFAWRCANFQHPIEGICCTALGMSVVCRQCVVFGPRGRPLREHIRTYEVETHAQWQATGRLLYCFESHCCKSKRVGCSSQIWYLLTGTERWSH